MEIVQKDCTNIISFIGIDARRVILGFMLANAFLSMWI